MLHIIFAMLHIKMRHAHFFDQQLGLWAVIVNTSDCGWRMSDVFQHGL
jgi:hypothetical protein